MQLFVVTGAAATAGAFSGGPKQQKLRAGGEAFHCNTLHRPFGSQMLSVNR